MIEEDNSNSLKRYVEEGTQYRMLLYFHFFLFDDNDKAKEYFKGRRNHNTQELIFYSQCYSHYKKNLLYFKVKFNK